MTFYIYNYQHFHIWAKFFVILFGCSSLILQGVAHEQPSFEAISSAELWVLHMEIFQFLRKYGVIKGAIAAIDWMLRVQTWHHLISYHTGSCPHAIQRKQWHIATLSLIASVLIFNLRGVLGSPDKAWLESFTLKTAPWPVLAVQIL